MNEPGRNARVTVSTMNGNSAKAKNINEARSWAATWTENHHPQVVMTVEELDDLQEVAKWKQSFESVAAKTRESNYETKLIVNQMFEQREEVNKDILQLMRDKEFLESEVAATIKKLADADQRLALKRARHSRLDDKLRHTERTYDSILRNAETLKENIFAFSKTDSDFSGHLDLEEFLSSGLGTEDDFRRADVNSSGFVDIAEFRAFKADKNEDGMLTRSEFVKANLGSTLAFDAADTNKDGTVSLEEANAFLQQHEARLRREEKEEDFEIEKKLEIARELDLMQESSRSLK